MKVVSGHELARALKKHGWELKRVNGSHHIFTKTGSSMRLSVPVHGNHALKRGLLAHLLKQAGLSEKDL